MGNRREKKEMSPIIYDGEKRLFSIPFVRVGEVWKTLRVNLYGIKEWIPFVNTLKIHFSIRGYLKIRADKIKNILRPFALSTKTRLLSVGSGVEFFFSTLPLQIRPFLKIVGEKIRNRIKSILSLTVVLTRREAFPGRFRTKTSLIFRPWVKVSLVSKEKFRKNFSLLTLFKGARGEGKSQKVRPSSKFQLQVFVRTFTEKVLHYKGKRTFKLKPRIFRGWISVFKTKISIGIKDFFTLYSGARVRFEGRAPTTLGLRFIFTKGARIKVEDRFLVLSKRLLGVLKIGELKKIFTQGLPSFRVKFFTYIKEVRPTLLKAKTGFSLKVKAYFYLLQCEGIIFRQKVFQKLAFMGDLIPKAPSSNRIVEKKNLSLLGGLSVLDTVWHFQKENSLFIYQVKKAEKLEAGVLEIDNWSRFEQDGDKVYIYKPKRYKLVGDTLYIDYLDDSTTE